MSTETKLVERFQCPGCVVGSNTKCGMYKADPEGPFARCIMHVAGTFMPPIGSIALGLPKGFNRFGFEHDGKHRNQMFIRLYPKGTHPPYDHLNVAVWAMEEDGFLFVRAYSPRINLAYIDVIEGGTRAEICPKSIDVATFIKEID